jgi:predicted dehydrogenase
MNQQNSSQIEAPVTRRSFLKSSSGIVAAAAAANFPFVLTSRAAADEPAIKVALVGCGGRGRDAANNVKAAAENVQILSVADIFPQAAERAARTLQVPAEATFSGWDAYQKAINVPGVNYVILATPPGFRPMHFKAAVEAGKHVFTEKPVAVDAPGIRQFLEAGKLAEQKKLCVVAGTQRRHTPAYIETIKRIHDGMIGEVLCLRAYWNQNNIWHRGYDPSKSEMENQVNNWYHYTWLCGDHIVEQHIHNLDVCNWVMNAHPIRAYGTGGRQALGDKPGHIWDHFAVEYEYANGVRMFSQCRQINGTTGRVREDVVGTKGTSGPENSITVTGGEKWSYSGRRPNGQVQEHTDLIATIRAGEYVNESQQVADSTLTAIIGRESAYSGKIVTWEEAMQWKTSLMPEKLEWGPAPIRPVPVPGKHEMT